MLKYTSSPAVKLFKRFPSTVAVLHRLALVCRSTLHSLLCCQPRPLAASSRGSALSGGFQPPALSAGLPGRGVQTPSGTHTSQSRQARSPALAWPPSVPGSSRHGYCAPACAPLWASRLPTPPHTHRATCSPRTPPRAPSCSPSPDPAPAWAAP